MYRLLATVGVTPFQGQLKTVKRFAIDAEAFIISSHPH